MALSRIAWLFTVGLCVAAAVLLLLEGYLGYFGVLLAVGLAASVNLLQWPRSTAPTEKDVASRH